MQANPLQLPNRQAPVKALVVVNLQVPQNQEVNRQVRVHLLALVPLNLLVLQKAHLNLRLPRCLLALHYRLVLVLVLAYLHQQVCLRVLLVVRVKVQAPP